MWIELLGILAGICTTFSVIPQIKQMIKTRSTKDISYMMYLINCTGFILWLTYGCLINSVSLVLANVVTLSLQATVLVLKYRWEKIISKKG